MKQIDPATLQRVIDGGSPPALLDVREAGEYNTAHIPGASSLPRRLIEFYAGWLVPCPAAPIVVCDDTGPRAAPAAATLERMGYTDVAVLTGGVNGWASDGLPTEWGMNVPSKEFGEAVEVRHHVPTIAARALAQRIQAGEPLVILDTRTPEEFRRACIPGARSLPGGELAGQITDIVRRQPEATIVVNCAGRTRSIIGARLLQRMGIDNVVSLQNGTAGWILAGLELEQGAQRSEAAETSEQGRTAAAAFARRCAAEDGVRLLAIAELRRLLARRDQECVYLVDVRRNEEFAAGHIPGFRWFPGGQAVQRSDDVVAVRSAAIVFASGGDIRSRIVASWYRQMGFPNVFALEGGIGAWRSAGLTLDQGAEEPTPWGLAEASAHVTVVEPDQLVSQVAAPARRTVLFIDPSDAFARGHVPGSTWLPRGWLELRIATVAPDRDTPLAVTDGTGEQALLAAATLGELGYRDVGALVGGIERWRAAGLPLERGLSGIMSPPEDVIPSGPDRSHAGMIHYLSWEQALGRS